MIVGVVSDLKRFALDFDAMPEVYMPYKQFPILLNPFIAFRTTGEALSAATVIAGHKDPRAFDNPSQIQATRRYLTDARRLLESSESAGEFYQEMLRLHPGRINQGALWGAAITLFSTIGAP